MKIHIIVTEDDHREVHVAYANSESETLARVSNLVACEGILLRAISVVDTDCGTIKRIEPVLEGMKLALREANK